MKITILYENFELTEKIIKAMYGAKILYKEGDTVTIEFRYDIDAYHFGRLEMMEEMLLK